MRKSVILSIGLSLAIVACEDTSGPTGDQLTRVEALALAAEVLASSEGAASTSASAEAGAAVSPGMAGGPPVNFSQEHESTHPCPAGGQLAIAFELNGTFDEDTNSLQANLQGTHTHSGCGFPHQGVTITVDGAPSIGFSASVGAVNGLPSQPFTFTLSGGFDWSASDGRSNTCQLSLEAVTDFTAQQRTVVGSVCGHTVDDTFNWSTE
jgi:hypothetical protein